MNRQNAPSPSRPRRTNRSSFLSKSHKRRRRFFRPLVEQLESRLLLATLGPDDIVISGFNGKIGALNVATEVLTIFADVPKARSLDFTSTNDRLFVVTDKEIVALDRDGNVVLTKNIEAHVGPFSGDMTIVGDTIYIATDNSSNPIQRFDLNGDYLGPFGPNTASIRDIEGLPDGTFVAGTHHLDADGNVIGTIGELDVGALAFDEANNDLLVFPQNSADIFRLDYPSFEVLDQGVGLVQFDAFNDAEIGSIFALSSTTFALEIFVGLVALKDISLNAIGGGFFLATQNKAPKAEVVAAKSATLLNDVDNDGKVDPGDMIQYQVDVSSSGDLPASMVTFKDTLDSNTTLIADSITIDGTPTTSFTPGIVDVDLGTIPTSETRVIRFNATINNDAIATITNQGTVTALNLDDDVLTDDPAQPGTSDPTETPLDVIVVSPPADSTADAVVVAGNGDNVVISINGTVSQTIPFADIATGTIVVLGTGDDDTLTIDFSGGNPVPTGGIDFRNAENSGTNNIELVGVTGDLVSDSLTGDRSGEINIGGSIIRFTGVNTIQDDFLGDREFNFGDGNDVANIECPVTANGTGAEGEGESNCTLSAADLSRAFPGGDAGQFMVHLDGGGGSNGLTIDAHGAAVKESRNGFQLPGSFNLTSKNFVVNIVNDGRKLTTSLICTPPDPENAFSPTCLLNVVDGPAHVIIDLDSHLPSPGPHDRIISVFDAEGRLTGFATDSNNAGDDPGQTTDPYLGPFTLYDGQHQIFVTDAENPPAVLDDPATRWALNPNVKTVVDDPIDLANPAFFGPDSVVDWFGNGDSSANFHFTPPAPLFTPATLDDVAQNLAVNVGDLIQVDERQGDAGHGGGSTIHFGGGNVGGVPRGYLSGDQGSIISEPFSLRGYSAADLPFLVFNYYADISPADITNVSIISRLGSQLVATSDTSGNVPDSVWPLDVGGGWQQAKIPLGDHAGMDNLRVRIDFFSDSLLDPIPELRTVPGNELTDGDTFTINGQKFEFDLGSTVRVPTGAAINEGEKLGITSGSGTTKEISLSSDNTATAAEVATRLAEAINQAFVNDSSIQAHPVGNRVNVPEAQQISTDPESKVTVEESPGVADGNFRVPVDFSFSSDDVAAVVAERVPRAFSPPALVVADGPSWFDGDTFVLDDGTNPPVVFEVDTGFLLKVSSDGGKTAPDENHPNPQGIRDGETITFSDGIGAITFEYDKDGQVAEGNHPVPISDDSTSDEIRDALAVAIREAITMDQVAQHFFQLIINLPGGLMQLFPRDELTGVVKFGPFSHMSSVPSFPVLLGVPEAGGDLTRGGIKDGRQIELRKGPTGVVFEFDNDGVIFGGDVLIPFSLESTQLEIAEAVVNALRGLDDETADALGLDKANTRVVDAGKWIVLDGTPGADVRLTPGNNLTPYISTPGIGSAFSFEIPETPTLVVPEPFKVTVLDTNIPDGALMTVKFTGSTAVLEFDNDGVFTDADSDGQPDNILITFSASDSAEEIEGKIADAIEAATPPPLVIPVPDTLESRDSFFEVVNDNGILYVFEWDDVSIASRPQIAVTAINATIPGANATFARPGFNGTVDPACQNTQNYPAGSTCILVPFVRGGATTVFYDGRIVAGPSIPATPPIRDGQTVRVVRGVKTATLEYDNNNSVSVGNIPIGFNRDNLRTELANKTWIQLDDQFPGEGITLDENGIIHFGLGFTVDSSGTPALSQSGQGDAVKDGDKIVFTVDGVPTAFEFNSDGALIDLDAIEIQVNTGDTQSDIAEAVRNAIEQQGLPTDPTLGVTVQSFGGPPVVQSPRFSIPISPADSSAAVAEDILDAINTTTAASGIKLDIGAAIDPNEPNRVELNPTGGGLPGLINFTGDFGLGVESLFLVPRPLPTHQNFIRFDGLSIDDPGPFGLVDGLPPRSSAGDVVPHEGFYIDDLVIGFAERGKIIKTDEVNTNFVGQGTSVEPFSLDISITTLPPPIGTNDPTIPGVIFSVPPGWLIPNGAEFSIGDGTNMAIFEFDDKSAANGVTEGHFPIDLAPSAPAHEVAASLLEAINGAAVQDVLPNLTAVPTDGPNSSGTPDTIFLFLGNTGLEPDGQLVVDSQLPIFNPIHVTPMRPTLSFNTIGGPVASADLNQQGELTVDTENDRAIVRQGANQVLILPNVIQNNGITLQLGGSPENDSFKINNVPPNFRLKANGRAGHDRVTFLNANQNVDLRSVVNQGGGEGEGEDLLDLHLQRIEIIDIPGSGDNSITLGVEDVLRISDTGTLEVIANAGDSVNIGPGWQLIETVVEDGSFVRIFEQDAATVRSIGPADWSNPSNPLDVNGNGSVEPVDVLIIFNELNNRRYSAAGGRLKSAADQATFPNFLFDSSPDGFVVPLDALVIINELNKPTGSAEGEDLRPFPAASMQSTNPFAHLMRVETGRGVRASNETSSRTGQHVQDGQATMANSSTTPERAIPRAVTYQELQEAIDEILADFDALLF
ncbi:MAG: dockerin type I domain-containing protein [Planctomycetota bacterium]|nr:dockerin type I domain-containing protein [Planctomycetota bacterium]